MDGGKMTECLLDVYRKVINSIRYGKHLLYWLIAISLAVPFYSFGQNAEKFNSIKVDFNAAGINKSVLWNQFISSPMVYSNRVEHHTRTRFIFINREHEKAIAHQIVDQAVKLNLLWKNSSAENRCNAILARFVRVMPAHFTPPGKIYIIDTDKINAFCLPDGTIFVFRGLLERFNDDELAWVIGHELGHGVAHHVSEMISKGIIQDVVIGYVGSDSNSLRVSGAQILQMFANLKYSRVQEDEADRLGLLYMNKAGFNMQGAIGVLNTFKQMSGNSQWIEWLSTHPHPENRLANVTTAIAQLQSNPDHVWISHEYEWVKDKLIILKNAVKNKTPVPIRNIPIRIQLK